MKLKKIIESAVIGYLVDPNGIGLVDAQGTALVYAGLAGRYLLTAKKRDTNLLASS
jgi:hypothetical protein